MNCQKATWLLSQKQDRALSRGERMSLKFHLMMCKACRNFDGNLAQLSRAFAKFNAGRQSGSGSKAGDPADRERP